MGLWVVTGYFLLMDALLERSSLGDVAKDVEAYHLEPVFSASSGGAMLLQVRGRLRLQRGDREGGLDDLRRCAETYARVWPSPCHSPWRSALALALPPAEDDVAGALIGQELALAQATGLARPTGVALRARACAGAARKAQDCCVSRWRSCGDPWHPSSWRAHS